MDSTNYKTLRMKFFQQGDSTGGWKSFLNLAKNAAKTTTWVLQTKPQRREFGEPQTRQHIMDLALRKTTWRTWRTSNTLTNDNLFQWWATLNNMNIADKRLKANAKHALTKLMEKRWHCNPLKPIILKVANAENVDKKELLDKTINDLYRNISQTFPIPKQWVQWQMAHTRFVHTKDKSIGDIMLNMGSAANADNVGRHTCKCNQIQSMWQQKFGCRLPMTDGHIFFTSDDYCGPCKNIFEVSSKCVPTSTNTQAIKSNNRLLSKLRYTIGNVTFRLTDNQLGGAEKAKGQGNRDQHKDFNCFPTRDEVDMVKKLLGHLVFSPIDKNSSKIVGNCPAQYLGDLQNMMGPQTKGYKLLHVRKFNKKLKNETLLKIKGNGQPTLTDITYPTKPHPNTKMGDWRDVRAFLKLIYESNKWGRFRPFNDGGFQKPSYIMYKHKNIADVETRKQKRQKTRIITPFSKHPAKMLLKDTARAMMALIKRWSSTDTILLQANNFPQVLKTMVHNLKHRTHAQLKIWDIEGMYPNTPKENIIENCRLFMDMVMGELDSKSRLRLKFVCVPHIKSEPVQILPHTLPDHSCFTIDDLMQIVNYSIDNCIVSATNQLYQQVVGVPMGDPLSPPIAIMVATIFEHQWASTRTTNMGKSIQIRRYMDDIIAIYTRDALGAMHAMDFEQNCYPKPPWNLELGGMDNVYLETKLTWNNGIIKCKHNDKNHNTPLPIWNFYKLVNAQSATATHTKMGTLIGEFGRMKGNCTDDHDFVLSIIRRIPELRDFANIPAKWLITAFTRLYNRTKHNTYAAIRDNIRQLYKETKYEGGCYTLRGIKI